MRFLEVAEDEFAAILKVSSVIYITSIIRMDIPRSVVRIVSVRICTRLGDVDV